MKNDFIKEFAYAKNVDGTLYYDHKEEMFVCISYHVDHLPEHVEFIHSFKQEPPKYIQPTQEPTTQQGTFKTLILHFIECMQNKHSKVETLLTWIIATFGASWLVYIVYNIIRITNP